VPKQTPSAYLARRPRSSLTTPTGAGVGPPTPDAMRHRVKHKPPTTCDNWREAFMAIVVLESQDEPQASTGELVLRHLRGHGPATSPKITESLGFSVVTGNKWLHRLKDQALVQKNGPLWSLTPAGVARTGPTTSATDFAAVLDLLPSEPHRALVRLARDAIVCRYHHADRGVSGWPAFALFGSSGTFKTGAARVLGRLFGMADHDHVVLVTDRSRTDLLGAKDHRGIWQPAPAMDHPVLTLDELDKATGEERTTALRMLQGDGVIAWGDATFTMRATIVATFNASSDPKEVLPEDRIRRLVMVRTTGLARHGDHRAAGRALLAERGVPVVDLCRLVPSLESISDEAVSILDVVTPRYLVEDAEHLCPSHALSLIVPGRVAFDELADDVEAAAAVGLDYLTTAETWGGTTPRLIAAYCRAVGIGEREPAEDAEEAARDIDRRDESVNLAETKELGHVVLTNEIAGLKGAEDPEGIRLRGAFKDLRHQLETAKNLREVERIDAVFRTLQDRAERRASQSAGRVAMGGAALPRSVPARTRVANAVPDRLAMLRQLRAAGYKEPPCRLLCDLGIVREDPMPPGAPMPNGQRFRATEAGQAGVEVFSRYDWSHPTVVGLLDATIAHEEAALAVSPTQGTRTIAIGVA
jgi:hypothetical protein